MKLFSLLLNVAFLAACTATLNEQNANKYDKTSVAPVPAEIPTAAPPMTSSNGPTTPATKLVTENAMSQSQDEKVIKMDDLPIEKPATVDHLLEAVESKPLTVTGFVTKSGDIYEIEDPNGMGKIQSRQTQDNEQHICNYGAVVIYSDIPCKQVTNVKVSEVAELPAVDQAPGSNTQQNTQASESNANKETEVKDTIETEQNNARRGTSSKRPNKNKNNQLQQQNKNKKRPNKTVQKRPTNNKNKSKNNKNKNKNKNKKRPSKNGQNRPTNNKNKNTNTNNKNKNKNKKRPNKNGQNRPTNTNKKNNQRPPQQINNRRWEEFQNLDNEYDFQRYFKNQRPQPAQAYVYEYYDE